MNQIENLNLQLDVLHDIILENLGKIDDCKTRKILIDLLRYQNKTTQLLVAHIDQILKGVSDDG